MSSSAQLFPYATPALLAWIYYRRVRRNFGPQAWQQTRMGIRLAVLALASLGLLFAAVFVPHAALPIAGAIAAGAVLGWFGLRHTHAEWRDGVRTYVPNPWIGGLLTLVLAARLAWRYGRGGGFSGGAAHPGALTLAIAAALVAYGACYGIGLALRMRALGAHPPA